MKLKCKICNKSFHHLGSHLWHGHKITAREYKTEYELPFKMALISDEVYKKKHDAFEKDREKFLSNLTKYGKKYQFKRGVSASGRRRSEWGKKEAIKTINGVNKNRKKEQCPVCKMIFDNLTSHLFNKHQLLKVN